VLITCSAWSSVSKLPLPAKETFLSPKQERGGAWGAGGRMVERKLRTMRELTGQASEAVGWLVSQSV